MSKSNSKEDLTLMESSDIDSMHPDGDEENEEIDEMSLPREKAKRILVTGGAGFIGSHVAEYLLRRGDTVVIVDEMNDYYDVRMKQANLDHLNRLFKDAVKIYKGDICDQPFIAAIFKKEKITHICHLAARAGVRPSIVDPYIYVHSNVEGTTRLLDLARKHACKNFVYASSSSVYGCSEKEVLSESDAVEKPVSPYAATKKAW
jgi:UDP-glucuronate 4-epimerase